MLNAIFFSFLLNWLWRRWLTQFYNTSSVYCILCVHYPKSQSVTSPTPPTLSPRDHQLPMPMSFFPFPFLALSLLPPSLTHLLTAVSLLSLRSSCLFNNKTILFFPHISGEDLLGWEIMSIVSQQSGEKNGEVCKCLKWADQLTVLWPH